MSAEGSEDETIIATQLLAEAEAPLDREYLGLKVDHLGESKKQNPQIVPYTTMGSFLGTFKGIHFLDPPLVWVPI